MSPRKTKAKKSRSNQAGPKQKEASLQAEFERLNALIDEKIASVGWVVMSVEADRVRREPGFSYTVGLAARGLPELLAFGLPHQIAQPILNDLARRLIDQGSLPMDVPVDQVVRGFPVVFRKLAPARARPFVRAAAQRAGGAVEVIQLVWPDPSGRFPWEPDFDPALRIAQRMLWSD
jgi:hypothetical protein